MNPSNMDNARTMVNCGKKATASVRNERMTRSLSSSASTSTAGGVTGTESEVAERLLSQDSGIEAKDLVDSDSITLPLSLIKGLRRKSSSIGIGSTSSGGGGSGNNSDNSGLVSFGENNSFGFNFDSEEGLMNSSPPNSERNGESDSDGNGPVDVTASSTNGSGMTGGVQGMEVDGTPASLPSQVTTSGSKQAQHMPPESKPSSSSLNSQRSGSGSSDSGGDSGSGSGSGSGSNGNGSRSSGKSTVSSLTMSSNSNENPNFLNVNSASMTQEAAADAAVAHLQSIASEYTPQNKSTKDAKKTQGRSSCRTSAQVSSKKKSSAGGKRKAEDDDEEDNDSGGYNSDDEGGMAASRAPLGDTSTATPDVAASLSAGTASATSALAPATAAVAPPTQTKSASKTSPSNKKAKTDRREERNQREKERSFRISRQINDLRNLLSSGGVIVPKGTKSAVLTEAANYIRMLQQHQYKSEIDRHQLIQQMQMIGGGALGPQAASTVRHVAAQNGVWSLGNFGGVPPRSAMTYYQQGPFGVPGSASPPQQEQQRTDPQLVTKIDEHEYRFVFNSCSVGMAIASMGGAFIDCNSLFCQLSQYSKQEVCSMTIFNLTSRQDLQHAFDLISKMISPPPDSNEGNSPPCVLRGAMKHRNDLGLSIALIKGEDGIAKCFCVTLIKNPSSPFDTSRPIPATADFLQVGGPQFTQTITEEKTQGSPPGSMSSPAYTTG